MDQRSFDNGKSRFDALDADGGDVAALLSALPRVEAPQNFDFGVKARIASGRPSSSGWLPFFKVAVPATLVLLVVALVAFYGVVPTTSNDTEVASMPIQESAPIAAPVAPPVREEAVSTSPAAAPVSGPQVADDPIAPERASIETERRGPVRRPVTAARPTDVRAEGGSVDLSLGSANTRMPKGFESVSPGRNTNADTGSREIPVAEVLQMLGVGADFVDGSWKVRSVSANTMAYRAGVRTGDVLEAINGRLLNAAMSFKGEFAGKSLSIRRDGRSMILGLNK